MGEQDLKEELDQLKEELAQLKGEREKERLTKAVLKAKPKQSKFSRILEHMSVEEILKVAEELGVNGPLAVIYLERQYGWDPKYTRGEMPDIAEE